MIKGAVALCLRSRLTTFSTKKLWPLTASKAVMVSASFLGREFFPVELAEARLENRGLIRRQMSGQVPIFLGIKGVDGPFALHHQAARPPTAPRPALSPRRTLSHKSGEI